MDISLQFIRDVIAGEHAADAVIERIPVMKTTVAFYAEIVAHLLRALHILQARNGAQPSEQNRKEVGRG